MFNNLIEKYLQKLIIKTIQYDLMFEPRIVNFWQTYYLNYTLDLESMGKKVFSFVQNDFYMNPVGLKLLSNQEEDKFEFFKSYFNIFCKQLKFIFSYMKADSDFFFSKDNVIIQLYVRAFKLDFELKNQMSFCSNQFDQEKISDLLLNVPKEVSERYKIILLFLINLHEKNGSEDFKLFSSHLLETMGFYLVCSEKYIKKNQLQKIKFNPEKNEVEMERFIRKDNIDNYCFSITQNTEIKKNITRVSNKNQYINDIHIYVKSEEKQ